MKKYFAESAYFPEGNEEEKKKAIEYLNYWKNNFLFKLKRETYEAFLVNEQFIERPAYLISSLAQNACISLKICVDIKFKYDLENYHECA